MNFLYRGFTPAGNARCYSFEAVEEQRSTLCQIFVELDLFTKNQLSFQSAPQFCLQILRAACQNEPERISDFVRYMVADSDFASLRSERAAQAEAAAQKRPPRRPAQKPSASSQLKYLPDPNRQRAT